MRVWESELLIQREYDEGLMDFLRGPPLVHAPQVRRAPFFRTTGGEECWRAVLSDADDSAIKLTLDFAFPGSTLEPPLSPDEQGEVVSAAPIGIHGITVCARRWLALHDALQSRYSTLKTFSMVAKNFSTARPSLGQRQIAERLRGCTVVLELLRRKTGSMLAYHCSPVVVTDPKPQLPDIFRQRGVPLTWVEGVEPLTTRSKLKECDHRVLFLDARHGCVLTLTECAEKSQTAEGRNIEPFLKQVWLDCVFRRSEGEGGMRARLEASCFVPDVEDEDEDEAENLLQRQPEDWLEGESRQFTTVEELWAWLDEALTGILPGWEVGKWGDEEEGVKFTWKRDILTYFPNGLEKRSRGV